MKDYFRKGLSGLVLGAYLAGGTVKASDSGNQDMIDIHHADSVEVLFEQPRYLKVGRKTLDCGKLYVIDSNSYIGKPEVALNSIYEYLEKLVNNYNTPKAKTALDNAIGKTLDMLTEETGEYNPVTRNRKGGRQLTDAGIARFKSAAADGMITPAEYEELGNGDVYVTQKTGKKLETGLKGEIYEVEQGRLDQGIIVRVDHGRDDCTKPGIVTRKLQQAPPADRREPTVQQPDQEYSEPSLEDTVQRYKPSDETKGVVEEEIKDKWGKRHPVVKKVLIGTGIAVGLAAAFIGLQKEEDKPSNRITGGPPY